ncbi:MAG: glycosyltransferase family 2 protein [Pseudomonadota bacterium]
MKIQQHTFKDSIEPILGAVVIARNEETLISQCLRSVLEALEVFPNAPVVFVDSDSSDHTVDIALSFPVYIYRYQADLLTAGAGRKIGFERVQSRYVLFVDGDCRIEKSWPALAIERMEKSPKTAVIYGPRREISKEGMDKPHSPQLDITTYEENGLGGNAMYRAEVLRTVGGFNPFLVGEEEGELLGRILATGYHITETTQIMYYHYTIPRDTPQDLLRRLRRGHFIGSGQALRLALQQGRFSFQARQLNRYLIMQLFLAVGFAAIVSSAILYNFTPFLLWLLAGVVFFGLLAVRRQSLVSASRIASEWFIGAIMVPIGFIRSIENIETFSPKIEEVKKLLTDGNEKD